MTFFDKNFKKQGNQKVKSIIVTEVTVRSPFITYSSQNPWNFLDMEVIMIKEDDKCLSPFQLKSIQVTFFQQEHATRHEKIQYTSLTNKKFRRKLFCQLLFRVRKRRSQSVLPGRFCFKRLPALGSSVHMLTFLQSLLKKICAGAGRALNFKS